MSVDRIDVRRHGGIQLSLPEGSVVTVIAVDRSNARTEVLPPQEYMIEIDPNVILQTLESFRSPTDDLGPSTEDFSFLVDDAKKRGLPVEQVASNVLAIVHQNRIAAASSGREPYVVKAREEMLRIIADIYTDKEALRSNRTPRHTY